MDIQSIYAEFRDRERRSRNIIIHDLIEDPNLQIEQRSKMDKQVAESIVSKFTNDKCVVSTMRLGKLHQNNESSKSPERNKPRPMKVVLQNKEYVLQILINKKKYKDEVKIGPDRTSQQRKHLAELLSNLQMAKKMVIQKRE
ncbi:hypothetical protein R5R35_010814 [Gryllus longicercus]|uniref:Uncharacterized protein n=1 Tax=Gryllus longicercus TaxID=2509291 RepID=A0AAN9W3T8_9ORTH